MDTARIEPVTIAKHGRPVVVVISIEEFERFKGHARELANDSTADSTGAMSEAR